MGGAGAIGATINGQWTTTDTLPTHVTPGGVLTWTPTITAPGGLWVKQFVVTVQQDCSGTLLNEVRVTTLEGATGVDTAISTVEPEGYEWYAIYLPMVLRN